jgi:hypothetical protein
MENVLILKIKFNSETDEEAKEFADELGTDIIDKEEVTHVEGQLNPEGE